MTDAHDAHIRLADPERDAAAVADIYRPAVEGSIASFEAVAPDAAEMARRIRVTLERTPGLVAHAGESVVGYAYAGAHRERAGYRWSVDVSAYVHPEWQGRRVGRSLYDELLATLQRQRFVNVYAGIALPNPASVALHESIGMRRIGVYERVGWKAGAWLDVAWYGMRIAEPSEPPAEPIPLPALRA
ncbi:MAG TPA: GNAT family N-acetyltransferase [Candidatus Limnocylindrales bacterium]|nr:GNAT family N-acetyltransferase [Candidatus Limnocylindrales bacterium]